MVWKKNRKGIVLIPFFILVLISATAFASVSDATNLAYFPGDGHVHTEYSWDAAFYKDNIEEMSLSGKSNGLSWEIITDHSDVVSFNLIRWDVMTPTDWQNQVAECQNVSQKLGITVLPGEEITIGNGTDLETRGHFLAYGVSNYVPSMYSKNDTKRRSGSDILSDVRKAGGFGFIAHPYPFGIWPKQLDAEGWREWDLLNSYEDVIRGIELLHDNHDPPQDTINRWDKELQQGKDFFAIGNSDAHREGKVASAFTYLSIPSGNITAENIYDALYKGHAIASNGPFVTFSIDDKWPGDYIVAQPGEVLKLNVVWGTNPADYNVWQTLSVYDQTASIEDKPTPLISQPIIGNSGSITIPYEVKEEGYVRLKLFTDKGKVAYTNPIFIKTPGAKRATQNISVALIIDSSGSMGWNDPHDLRKDAAKFFVDLAQMGDKIAIIDFDSAARVWEPLREIQSDADRAILKSAIDRVDSWGGTNIGAGLRRGYEQLLLDNSLNKKAAIILTDGIGSYSNQAQYYKDKGWPVYTIGLSGEADVNLLTKIANETGGKFYSAPTNEYLSQIYQELSEIFQSGTPIYKDRDTIFPGQIIEKIINIFANTLQITFSINWTGSELELTLVRPDGVEITSATIDPDMSHAKGPTYEMYRIDNPMPGEWKMRIKAVDVSESGEKVNINTSGLIETPPQTKITFPFNGTIVKGTTTITAQASDDEEIVEFHLSLNGEELTESPDNANISYTWDTTDFLDGVYQLSAIASDIKKSFGQDDVILVVDNTVPIAEAGPDQTVTAGSEVTFDASNSQDVAEFGFSWDFGDGTTEAAVGPLIKHIYSKPGKYIVTLTVQDAAGNTDTDTATVKVVPSIIPATVDIKPETLNLSSKGKWITAYIELPGEYDVSKIDISTVKLNDIVFAESSPIGIGDYDSDGIPDLMAKFDRSTVESLLQPGEEIITVAGRIEEKTFSGSDAIKTILTRNENKRNFLR
jgi:PKD repeat protein